MVSPQSSDAGKAMATADASNDKNGGGRMLISENSDDGKQALHDGSNTGKTRNDTIYLNAN